METEFVLFGAAHLSVLFAMIAISIGLVWLVRDGRSPRLSGRVGWGLAVVLVLNKIASLGLSWSEFGLSAEASLPMHLCDWAWICCVLALCGRWQLPYELAYYWGLAGTVQAVLTPDLPYGFPHPFFFTFFISHCGLVVAVVFMTFGKKMRPRPGSVWRAFGWLQIYFIAAASVDVVFGANYGYLCRKPAGSSLLDHMGPWPWYLAVAEVLALAMFWLLYLPFHLARPRLRS